jgi:hypothetical protein
MMSDPRWWSVIGLVLGVIGAGLLAWDVVKYVSRRRAVEDHGAFVLPVGGPVDPGRPDVMRAREAAKRGVLGYIFLIAGFLCQLVGSWPHR